MQRVAEIAPFGSGPGLAFICPDCSSTANTLAYPVTTAPEADQGHREQ
jgi:hypothetical protein